MDLGGIVRVDPFVECPLHACLNCRSPAVCPLATAREGDDCDTDTSTDRHRLAQSSVIVDAVVKRGVTPDETTMFGVTVPKNSM